jgi:hypothetical protein
MTTTHAYLIDALGGGQKVAEAVSDFLGLEGGDRVDREAVYKWKKENRIPYRWRDGVRALAIQGGLDLPADMMPPEPLLQPADKSSAA